MDTQTLNAKYGAPPTGITPSINSVSSSPTSFASLWGNTSQSNPDLGSRLATDWQNRGSRVADITRDTGTQSEGNALTRGLKVAGEGAGAIGDVLTESLASIFGKGTDTNQLAPGQASSTEQASNVDSTKIHKAIFDWSQAHPDAYNKLKNTLEAITASGNIAGTIAGAEVVPDTGISKVSEIPGAIKQTGSDIAQTGKNIAGKAKAVVTKTPEQIAAIKLQNTTEAVNPNLTGKKLVNAYKDSVTGTRNVKSASIFGDQGLSADEQTKNLANRLHENGVYLGKDPVKNLDTLKSALNDTETKLQTALKGDPEINVSLDKPTLISKLEDLKSNMPREFKGIRDSKKTFNNVIDFAKETISKAEDSIMGGRDARSTFDAQAKREFPSAFKDGKIDIATPAGRAIKASRDLINEHIYNTAPNGSEIQKLIGQEADIFRATDVSAEKAATSHGKNSYEIMKDNHPNIKKGIDLGKKVIPFGIATHL